MFRPATRIVAMPLGVLVEMMPAATRGAAARRAYSVQSTSQHLEQLWWKRKNQVQTPMRRIGTGFSRPSLSPRARAPLRGPSRRGFRSSARRAADSQSAKPNDEPQSLSGRLKKLSREYGWAAVGVYLGLSVLDFPFCFLLVRTVGTERIGKIEHTVVSTVTNMIPEPVRTQGREWWLALKQKEKSNLGEGEITEAAEMATWGVKEAQDRANETASLATQLALAYAIHKSFIFIRVPLTAAVTPRVVKTLRSWGWNIGKRVQR